MQVAIFDSDGMERRASLFATSSGRIDYLVPRETAAGKAVAIVSNGGAPIAAIAMDIDPVAPRLFTLSDSTTAAAAVQRVKADRSESYGLVQGPIDPGPPGDNAF